jgi:hypothetical protein
VEEESMQMELDVTAPIRLNVSHVLW